MFDTTQTVNTEALADALSNLAALFLKPEQLVKTKVTDRADRDHYLCPGMITRIEPLRNYEKPDQILSLVYYVNGDEFSVDLAPALLAHQLGIDEPSA